MLRSPSLLRSVLSTTSKKSSPMTKLRALSTLPKQYLETPATKAHQESLTNPQAFWEEQAKRITWFQKYDQVLRQDEDGYGQWFLNGKMNTCYNALDRHIEAGLGSKTALIFDSPVSQTIQKYTYSELQHEVVKLANYMLSQGIVKGDRIVIYMPNIPEAAISMLACARIGAIHSVVFGGFAAPELATRIRDCQPKMILSASCGIDGQKIIDYKQLLDHALELTKEYTHVHSTLIYQRNQLPAKLIAGRDFHWQDELAKTKIVRKDCESMNSQDPLYVLYTSGTTGSPKGVVRDSGGYAVALAWSMANVYNMKQNDVFWAASDVGWVVGHSFSVYGPLIHGCTTVLYEGKPVGTPDAANYWRTIERHNVNAMFTAPTAIRAIKRIDEKGELPKDFNISSLRTLFLAGERADPDSLKWAEKALNIPVRDHWWQTETGWPICANTIGLEGYIPVKYGSTFRPCPGYNVQILDDAHQQQEVNKLGKIVIKLPLPPGALTTLYHNHERFEQSYLTEVPGYYDTGDAGYIDQDGYVYIMSRTDDVMNVAGHRLSSGAMEEVIADHEDVAEVAVVGLKDELKGHIPLGLIVLNAKINKPKEVIVKDVIGMIRERIGPVASFKDAVIVDRLPKTRSGKVLRATLRAIANEDPYKVPATIEDPTVLEEVAVIIKNYHHK